MSWPMLAQPAQRLSDLPKSARKPETGRGEREDCLAKQSSRFNLLCHDMQTFLGEGGEAIGKNRTREAVVTANDVKLGGLSIEEVDQRCRASCWDPKARL